MLSIGEFSNLSKLTVKTLRYYEREGLLLPAQVEKDSGYRHYNTSQLLDAGRIKSYRQLGLTIDEIRSLLGGTPLEPLLEEKAAEIEAIREDATRRLSIISYLLKEKKMEYEVVVKEVPSYIVYSAEGVLPSYGDLMEFVPKCGAECLALNPDLKCVEPPYEFCEYLDVEYKETDVRVRHSEAVTQFGVESDFIKFRQIPACKVLSIYHRGPYEFIGDAYNYIIRYAESNGYVCDGLARECYIDGIWNKEDPADWLTEVQLPIK